MRLAISATIAIAWIARGAQTCPADDDIRERLRHFFTHRVRDRIGVISIVQTGARKNCLGGPAFHRLPLQLSQNKIDGALGDSPGGCVLHANDRNELPRAAVVPMIDDARVSEQRHPAVRRSCRDDAAMHERDFIRPEPKGGEGLIDVGEKRIHLFTAGALIIRLPLVW